MYKRNYSFRMDIVEKVFKVNRRVVINFPLNLQTNIIAQTDTV